MQSVPERAPLRAGLLVLALALAFALLAGDLPASVPVLAQLRAPRVALAALAGALLACSGLALQSVFRNPLAAPDLLGVSSGAALGAVLALLTGAAVAGVQGAAVAGGVLAVAAVRLVGARWRLSDPLLGLILAGVALTSLCGALIALVLSLADPTRQLPTITFWLMGSLVGASWDQVAWLAVAGALAGFLWLRQRWRADLLLLSDDEIRSTGVDPARLRLELVAAATVATAVAVAVCGVIGWIGLLVPHAARRLAGGSFAVLLPLTAVLGALLLVLVDGATRAWSPIEIAPGVVTALLGAPALIVLALARRDD